jgi:UDP-3-O-[3-hydroxymyristoyl] glucosamine N-acyltransferase
LAHSRLWFLAMPLSRWSHIAATHRVEIGDGVLIGSKVLITDHKEPV